jgi:triacylglycerol esterase/lipase EstA (alpha/beta hydrolase family)
MQTYQGIDKCGDRLASEILALVEQHQNLEYISMLGHSMGGLLIRYAAGRLFDADTGRVAGLKPIHFITMASPHLGCDAVGEAQVRLSSKYSAVILPATCLHWLAPSAHLAQVRAGCMPRLATSEQG